MHGHRIAHVFRWLDAVYPRRLAVAGGMALVTALSLAERGAVTDARKKHKKKRKKKKPTPPSCRELCGAGCVFCFYRADAPPLCGDNVGHLCSSPCTTDNDCAGSDFPYCGTSIGRPESDQRETVCFGGGGFCGNIIVTCSP